MLDAADVAALLAARHGDPFAVLGMHADATGAQCVRALLPGAEAVDLIDAADGTLVWPAEAPPSRWLLRIPHPPPQALRLPPARALARRQRGEYADAYAYGPQLVRRRP
jgi:1,4-alpha-glucan branching enzyme